MPRLAVGTVVLVCPLRPRSLDLRRQRMIRVPKKPKPAPATGPGLAVCHGCCCARDDAKRRSPADFARLERLRAATTDADGRVTVIDCLGPCEHSDVVVVRPSPAGRAEGGRPVWLGWVGDYEIDLICEWLAEGGPGVADQPALLDLNVFKPPRGYRDDLDHTVSG